jgi:allantoin racemase
MKIVLACGNQYELFKVLYDQVREVVRKAARPGTELIFKHAKNNVLSVQYQYLNYYSTMQMIEMVVEAEKEGADAAFMACACDPGLDVMKQAVNIPVAGPLQSGALIATMMGHKFSLITPMPEFVPFMEGKLISYGVRDKLISLRSMGWGNEWYEWSITNQKKVVEKFTEVAKRCIDDGAEVLLPGCICLDYVFCSQGVSEIEGVPIVPALASALKMLEILVDLREAPFELMTSRKALYKSAPKEEVDELRKNFNVD